MRGRVGVGVVVVVAGLVLGLGAAPARADLGVRWGAEAEYGALVSQAQGERRDLAGLVSFQLRGIVRPSPRWEVAFAVGIPQPVPSLSLQVPLTLHYRVVRRLRLHGGVRWIYSWVELCAEGPEQCPRQQELTDPYQRGGSMVGLAGELGVSYEWPARWGLALRVAASYLRGSFVGLATASEPTLGGVYQGGVFSFGIVTP